MEKWLSDEYRDFIDKFGPVEAINCYTLSHEEIVELVRLLEIGCSNAEANEDKGRW